ncbi:MAG TPA: aldo/keto reductase [Bryobacteraceae bacterium]|jgi:aryl-alcohol dehydrogenase-like predicted oxidoreductase|nr:aldo/keto reductase [Bryobacteraceae bacterium]
MQTRQLGNSDLQITPLGVGSWAIGGGGYQFGWGPQDDNDSVAAIHAAADHGINWIDTAPVYGLGRSEEVVGRALKGRSKRPYVFTKCSIVWDEKREPTRTLKADSVRRECEESLRRLQIDAIDLWQIHWPDPEPEIEEGWRAMADLQKAGKVRWIGVSNFKPAQMDRLRAIAPVTSNQPPYSILSPEIEAEIMPYCGSHNIGLLVYSPMKSGLLTGAMTRERIAKMPPDDFRQRTVSFKEPLLTRNLNLVELMRAIGNRHGKTPGEVALAWVLRKPEVTGAIVGMRSPNQVEGVVGAADFRLSAGEVEEITKFLQENTAAAGA